MRTALREPNPIDEVVGALAARLPGGLIGQRSDLLLEARDGLEDAAARYRAAGLDERAAAQRAVAEFGDVDGLTADYAAHVVASSVRVAALVLGGGYLVMLAAWLVVNRMTADLPTPQHSSPAAQSFSWFGLGALLVTAVVLLMIRRRARRQRFSLSLAWIVGASGCGLAIATLVASYLVEPWNARVGGGSGSGNLLRTVEILSGVTTAAILVCSLSCLWSAWVVRRRNSAGA